MDSANMQDLARRFVLAEDKNEQDKIAETAAKGECFGSSPSPVSQTHDFRLAIQESQNSRQVVHQFAASIGSFLGNGEDADGEEDRVARAKGMFELLCSLHESLPDLFLQLLLFWQRHLNSSAQALREL